jgi:hypothetical protein
MQATIRVIINYVQGSKDYFLLRNTEMGHGRGSSFDWDLKDGSYLNNQEVREIRTQQIQDSDAGMDRVYLGVD